LGAECHFPKLDVVSLVFLKEWGVCVIYQKKKKKNSTTINTPNKEKTTQKQQTSQVLTIVW
jgi:hypothetical protein